MLEIILTNISLLIGIIGGAVGALIGFKKWWDSKMKGSYDKGKSEEACLNRIEDLAQKALTIAYDTQKTLNAEVKKASEYHADFYKQIGSLNKDLSYIRGKIEKL